MNVSLTPEWERFIKKRIKSGRYHSASEVVRTALRLMEEYEQSYGYRVWELKREIQKGIDDLEAGRGITLNDKTIGRFFEKVKREGRKKLLAAKQKRAG